MEAAQRIYLSPDDLHLLLAAIEDAEQATGDLIEAAGPSEALEARARYLSALYNKFDGIRCAAANA